MNYFFLLYFLLRTAPFAFTGFYSLYKLRAFPYAETLPSYFLLISVILLILSEFLIYSLVGNKINKLKDVGPRRFLAPLFVFTVGTYHLIVFTSWYIFFKTDVFITSRLIELLTFLSDFSFIKSGISINELAILTCLGVISWTIPVIFLKSKLQPRTKRNPTFSFSLALLLVSASRLIMQAEDKIVFSNTAAFSLSPEYSILWAKLFFPITRTVDDSLTLDLLPKTELTRWLDELKPENSGKKNIVLFVIEALRSDIIGTGTMPTVDSLAANGQSFKHAYCLDPETSESMLTIITGQHPLRSERRDFRKEWDFPFVKIYDALSMVGYRTAYLGEEWSMDKAVTDSKLLSLRFDPKASSENRWNYELAPHDSLKLETFQSWIRQDKVQPFFGLVYLAGSHFPYDQSQNAVNPFQPTKVGHTVSFLSYPEEKKLPMWNRYRNSLHTIDSKIKEFIEQLGDRAKDTIIIITGDHGEQFLEHGHVGHGRELDEEALKVPLIFVNAPILQTLKTRVTSHLDIAPTILTLAHVDKPCPAFQGQSLYELARPNSELFLAVQAFSEELGVIHWPWKFVRNQRTLSTRLFQLEKDPGELENLANKNQTLAKVLESCVNLFQNQQLSYYSQLRNHRKLFLTPAIPRCLNGSKSY